MKIAFDTSVLVAGLVSAHPRYAVATVWLDALENNTIEGVWTTHAYAETWSVLTRLPLEQRIEPTDVQAVLESLCSLCEPAPLLVDDYIAAGARAGSAHLRSGAIFDALHLVAAERLGADALLTYNAGDFRRLSPNLIVALPPPRIEPPA